MGSLAEEVRCGPKYPAAGLAVRIDPPATAAENMAEDRRCLEAAEMSEEPFSLLRLYRWNPAAVSFGRHQKPELSLDVEFCRLRKIPVVRRPTGGRAVFHHRELTYALVSNLAVVSAGAKVSETYRLVAGVLFRALSGLGAPVEMARRPQILQTRGPAVRQRACFASTARYELLASGRKLAGSAQCRLKRAILQHGSIPLEIDYPLMALALGCEEADLRRSMISLEEACGRGVSFAEAAEALRTAFIEVFAELHSGEAVAVAGGSREGSEVDSAMAGERLGGESLVFPWGGE